MAEQVMDVRSSTVFLRRRWRPLVTMGVVGAVLGVLYVTLVPAPLASSTLLLFPGTSQDETTPGEDETATQVHIVRSIPVLERAGKSVKPALSTGEVKQRIKVDARTSKLIEIRAFSRNAEQAQALSQAVAEAYLKTLQGDAQSLNALPADVRSREDTLRNQLKTAQTDIGDTKERLQGEDPTSSDGLRDRRLLTQLRAQQRDVLLQLDKLKGAANETPSGASELPDIIQPAAPATGPSLPGRLLTWTVAGALLTVAGTALVLLIRRLRDPRVRARDDLADAVGSSLLAVVRSRPQRSVAGWLALFETYEPSAEEAWAFRQVLRALAGSGDRDPTRTSTKRSPGRLEHPASLTVVALSGDQRGVAVGPQLAAFAASLGIATQFTVATRHDSVASLYAACATGRGSELRPGLVLEARSEGATPAQEASAHPMDPPLTKPLKGGFAKESRLQEALGDYSVVHPPRGMTETAQQEAAAEAELQEMATQPSVDLTIVFAVADRREPTLRQVPATAVTMLAISPGVGTREELARLAVAVDDAGGRIDGVVIADPDPSDRTTGRRTLDERALQAPLPVRLTGPSQVSMSPSGRRKAR
jgi:capsular polysaccharide biosynthesis protein